MSWNSIYLKDNWGNKSLHTDPEFKSPPVQPGRHRIKWKNKQTANVNIFAKPQTEDVSDHGHTYQVLTEMLYVTIKYRGASLDVPVVDIVSKIWVP
jgi:hypothetical protein